MNTVGKFSCSLLLFVCSTWSCQDGECNFFGIRRNLERSGEANDSNADALVGNKVVQGSGGGGGGGGGGGSGGGGRSAWSWAGGGGGGGGGGRGGGGGGGGWGWGGGGGGSGWWKWGCGRNPSHGDRSSGTGHDRKGEFNNNDHVMGEFAQCMVKGRCKGMRLDCPLHCGGPCLYDCRFMCKAHCQRPGKMTTNDKRPKSFKVY